MEKQGVVAAIIAGKREIVPRRTSLERLSHDPNGILDGAQPEPEYLSIAEAADLLGVRARSVYCYLEDGSLSGVRVGRAMMLRKDEVLCFQRKAPGRVRVHTPPWRVPPAQNIPYLTLITVQLRPGQEENLEHVLHEIWMMGKHSLLGTAARYIARRADEVEIVLLWRSAAMPEDEQCISTLKALCEDLKEICDWETAVWKDARVLLRA